MKVLIVHPDSDVLARINTVRGILAIPPGAYVAGWTFDLILICSLEPHPKNEAWLAELRARLANENSRMVFL